MRRPIQIALVAAAVGVALVPLPRALVERIYSRRVYPLIQPALTSFSNHVPFPLFDVLLVGFIAGVIALWFLRLRRAAPGSMRGALLDPCLDTAAAGALVYFWFLATWGLNYQRQPLRTQLDFQEERISGAGLRDLALRDVDSLNRLHDAAHRDGWPELNGSVAILADPFDRAQHDLASPWRAVPARPKASLLDLYFRRVGVDGMTDPFFLETLSNHSLLPFERPFVVAHEWSHLAGYADESEANFLAWLICLRGREADQYSAWISLYGTIVSALPPREREEVADRLQPGPAADLRAMAERVAEQVNPRISRAGYAAYDRFLKANRVRAGVRSYAEVLRLLLGTRFHPDGSPALRNSG